VHGFGIDTTADNGFSDPFGGSEYHINGPAIVKLQANASANNTTLIGGFNGYLR